VRPQPPEDEIESPALQAARRGAIWRFGWVRKRTLLPPRAPMLSTSRLSRLSHPQKSSYLRVHSNTAHQASAAIKHMIKLFPDLADLELIPVPTKASGAVVAALDSSSILEAIHVRESTPMPALETKVQLPPSSGAAIN